MKKQFVTYEIAVAMEELGFKDECLGYYDRQSGELFFNDLDRGVMPSDGVEITSGKAATDSNGATLQYAWNTPTAQIYLGEYDSLFEVNDSGSGSASGT